VVQRALSLPFEQVVSRARELLPDRAAEMLFTPKTSCLLNRSTRVMTEFRRETDSMGVVEVPADKLWGAQSEATDPAWNVLRICRNSFNSMSTNRSIKTWPESAAAGG
jgi:hypothetical protein